MSLEVVTMLFVLIILWLASQILNLHGTHSRPLGHTTISTFIFYNDGKIDKHPPFSSLEFPILTKITIENMIIFLLI